MKAKKIFNAVLTVGTLAGVGFGAYKFGEFVGEDKEKKKRSSNNDYFGFFDDDEDNAYEDWCNLCGEYSDICDNYRELVDELIKENNKLRNNSDNDGKDSENND